VSNASEDMVCHTLRRTRFQPPAARASTLKLLDFDDQHPFHQHVDPVPTIQVDVQATDPNRHLPLHLQSPLSQRRLEADLVRVLEHARPEITVDIDGSADDLAGRPIRVEFP
jgi:hypothetical protein